MSWCRKGLHLLVTWLVGVELHRTVPQEVVNLRDLNDTGTNPNDWAAALWGGQNFKIGGSERSISEAARALMRNIYALYKIKKTGRRAAPGVRIFARIPDVQDYRNFKA